MKHAMSLPAQSNKLRASHGFNSAAGNPNGPKHLNNQHLLWRKELLGDIGSIIDDFGNRRAHTFFRFSFLGQGGESIC
jgi:hypothetical protein